MKTPRMFPIRSRAALAALILLTLALSACGGMAGDSWSGVALGKDQNIVYLAFEEKIVALDTADGTRLWEYPAKDDREAKFYAVPTLDNGTLYIGDWEGRLHSVNSADGTKNWIYTPDRETIVGPVSLKATDRVISGVAVDSDKVFFGLGSENVVALSRGTAAEIWTFKTGHGVWGTPLYLPANPEVAGSRAVLYVVSLDHHLYALDPESGNTLWSKDLGGAAPGNMVYDAELNRLYIGTFASELVVLDLAVRDIVARYETEGWLWDGPAVDIQDDGSRLLYFGDVKGYLYAVRATEDGFEEIWKQHVADDTIRSTPLIVGDHLYVGSKDKHIYAINKADGTVAWNNETDGEVLSEFVSAPVGSGDEASTLVIVSTSDDNNRLVAYQSTTGDQVWRYSD